MGRIYCRWLDGSRPTLSARLFLSAVDAGLIAIRRTGVAPPRYRMHDGPPSYTVWRRNGRAFLNTLRAYAALTPSSAVLDIGSGAGRKAAAIVPFLVNGSYEGFDPVRGGVSWCTDNLALRYPQARFLHFDIENGYYNPCGSVVAREFKFPYEDEQFDVVFASSVFTHVLPEVVINYFEEAHRVAKPTGSLVASFFLLSDVSRLGIASGSSRYSFAVEHNDYWASEDSLTEHVVAYDSEWITDLGNSCGFTLSSYLPGSWCGRRKYHDFQDILVFQKSWP